MVIKQDRCTIGHNYVQLYIALSEVAINIQLSDLSCNKWITNNNNHSLIQNQQYVYTQVNLFHKIACVF